MNGRLRLNIALAAAVVILAAIGYFQPGIKLPGTKVQLITLKPAEIHAIRIQLPGQKPTEMTHGERGWQITSPLSMPADPNLVRTLLDYMDVESTTHFVAANVDLGKYGLDKPKARLWLNGEEYDFGGLQPVDNLQYVLTAGSIHLVSGALFYRVAHDVYGWIDKGLVPLGARVTALQLPHSTLSLDAKSEWQLAPADASVSADDMQRLAQAWEEDLAISVAPIGKDPEQGEVSLSLAGAKQPLRFAILKDPDFLVLARPDLGLQYELDSSLRDALLSLSHPKPAPKH